MKRRFAYSKDDKNDVSLKRIDKDYFNGYVCKINFDKVDKPIKVKVQDEEYYIKNDNYIWYEVYPDDSNYALTIMYDENNKLIEWYFDVSKKIGVENGVPYEDDLYLDLVINSLGESTVLDEDELNAALNKKDITTDDYNLAYEVLNDLQREYVDNFDHLIALTERIKGEFNKKRGI